MSLLEITLKLLLAVALGGLIGLERESSHKPAGFRTNILICVGATMMMVLSGLIFQGKEGIENHLSRIAAGVITGIGFIGAGTIIQAGGIVVGLTTAATLWAVAGLGLVIGAGHYWIALKFRELNLKKEGNISVIDFSFQSTEEKEQKFNQSLLGLEEILEIKIA